MKARLAAMEAEAAKLREVGTHTHCYVLTLPITFGPHLHWTCHVSNNF